MGKLRAFSTTKVTQEKTQSDLKKELAKHGVKASRWTDIEEDRAKGEPGSLTLEFQRHNEQGILMTYRVSVEYQFIQARGQKAGAMDPEGSTAEQAARAIYWHVKNLLDSADYGIVSFEQAMLPHTVTANGTTIYEELAPRMREITASKVPPAFALEMR